MKSKNIEHECLKEDCSFLIKKTDLGRIGLRKKMLNAAFDLTILPKVVFGEK